MKLRVFLTIASIIAGVFGLALFFVPKQLMTIYGAALGTMSACFLDRFLGATFIGIAVLNLLALKSTSSEALRVIVMGDFVISLLGLIVALWEVFGGQGYTMAWTTVVIYLFLTLGLGYFQFLKPANSWAGA